MKKRVLIADDESIIRDTLSSVLSEAGYTVNTAADGIGAVELLETSSIDVALIDIRMPGMNGMEVLAKARETSPDTIVILMTAFGTVENAVEAVKLGASDYVTKPFVFDDILIKIKRLLELRSLTNERRVLLRELGDRHRFAGIIGASQGLQRVLGMVKKLAQTRSSALISGESGTGKELIARAIHYNGLTKEGRFVAINCGSLPEALAESELFGHSRGAFTGAIRDKPGLFAMGDGGTIFLDEICSMPLAVQAKLLRAIEEMKILPVGATTPVDINARILCATNRNLIEEVRAGRFREDLYYRLNVVEINVPPLRERRDDISPLLDHFVEKYSRELNKDCPGVSQGARQAMVAYAWPGNVRELENVIERAIIFSEGKTIEIEDLAFVVARDATGESWGGDLKSRMLAFEKQYISEVLEAHQYDKQAAACALEVGLSSLYRKIKQLDIPDEEGVYEPQDVPVSPGGPPDKQDLLRTDR